MLKVIRPLFLALAFMFLGFAAARFDLVDLPAAAQQATPGTGSTVAPTTRDVKPTVRESAANLAPDIKLLVEQVGKRIEALEQRLNKLADEARAKAITYALWAAGGLFVLMFLAAVLGGTLVAVVFRRSRAA